MAKKKGWEFKNKFDSWPLKVKNHLDLRVCRWRAKYHWKALDEGYNFALDFISMKGLHKKSWAFKLLRVPISKISELLTWESWEKWHLDATLMANYRKDYKEGRWWLTLNLGGGESCESVYAHGMSVHWKRF
jgi:hypothetical protein